VWLLLKKYFVALHSTLFNRLPAMFSQLCAKGYMGFGDFWAARYLVHKTSHHNRSWFCSTRKTILFKHREKIEVEMICLQLTKTLG
jgi:hypothetical protein